MGLLESYLDALRYGVEGVSEVGYKGGTIRVYIGGIGATCRDFGVKSPTDDRTLQRWIKKFEEVRPVATTVFMICRKDSM